MDKTDVDRYFYHNIFDISQSQHQLVGFRLQQNVFCTKVVQILRFKVTVALYPPNQKWKSSKDNSVLWLTVCASSSKNLIKQASVYKLLYRNTKMRLNPQGQKKISFIITIRMSLNVQADASFYRFTLETTIVASFLSSFLNYTAINLLLQEFLTLTIVKFTIFTRTDITLQTILSYLRTITMCGAFTPDCGYGHRTIIPIGDVYCPDAECSSKLWLHKKTFQSLGRSEYQCPQCASVCQVRNTLL